MPVWYYMFTVAVVAVWLMATDRDRNAARLVCAATVISQVIYHTLSSHIQGPWKLAIAGTVDFSTLLALLILRTGPAGCINAAALFTAWLAHAVCFYDLIVSTSLVYAHYGKIIAVIAAVQLAAFHDTLAHVFSRVAFFATAYARPDSLRVSGACAGLLLRPSGVAHRPTHSP